MTPPQAVLGRPGRGRTTYSRRRHIAALVVATGVAASVGLWSVVGDLENAVHEPGLLLFTVAMVAATARGLVLGIVVTSRGVLIRNWTRTHTVPWADITSIRPQWEQGWRRTPGVEMVRPGIDFRLTGGRVITAIGFDREWGEAPDLRVAVAQEIWNSRPPQSGG